MNTTSEMIRLYARQLKIPTFAEYEEILRQADPSADFGTLLLELMKTETASRQENQNKRRLKAAGFPYLKTLDEFDFNQLNEAVSPLFLNELASCQFIRQRQNIVMVGNPGRGKTHLSIALGLKHVRRDSTYCSRMRQHCRRSCVKRGTITVSENWNGLLRKRIC